MRNTTFLNARQKCWEMNYCVLECPLTLYCTMAINYITICLKVQEVCIFLTSVFMDFT